MSPAMEKDDRLHRGLAGVYLDRTRITQIDGENGRLLYRGYPIGQLAAHSCFEETAYLLLHGELPTAGEREAFDQRLRAAREVPGPILAMLRSMKDADPMDALRTAVSASAAFTKRSSGKAAANVLEQGLALIAQAPGMVGAHHAYRQGREPAPIELKLGHAAHIVQQIRGTAPDAEATGYIDLGLVVHADHGLNASAFAARVATGTGADLYAALTAAIGTFGGPLHGGAVVGVWEMLQEIGEPERTDEVLEARRKRGEPVMGFGHRVYRTEDPRAAPLRAAAKRLGEARGETKWFEMLEAVTGKMSRHMRHGINVNVDFYACVMYHLLGIPADLFVPIFVLGRMPGWLAQVMEQLEQNILIRPRLRYEGTPERDYPVLKGPE